MTLLESAWALGVDAYAGLRLRLFGDVGVSPAASSRPSDVCGEAPPLRCSTDACDGEAPLRGPFAACAAWAPSWWFDDELLSFWEQPFFPLVPLRRGYPGRA